MPVCSNCIHLQFCQKTRTRVVSADELKSAEYILDVRALAYSLDIPFRQWPKYIVDELWAYQGWIADWDGNRIELDLDVFERPNIVYWFRDFACTPCPPQVRPRVRREAMDRVIALATILKARHPGEAFLWGVRPANDNDPNFPVGEN